MRKTDDEIELKDLSYGNFMYQSKLLFPMGYAEIAPSLLWGGDEFICKLSPVHLSHDWLIAFGFETVDKHKYIHPPSEITLYNKGGWHYDYGKGESKIMLFHVHQLQNLFTLKNEDLVLVRPELIRK